MKQGMNIIRNLNNAPYNLYNAQLESMKLITRFKIQPLEQSIILCLKLK